MNETSQKVLDHIKAIGKTSGGKVKDKLGLSDSEYRKAKEELNENKLVVLGRGRGGTIEAIDGAEPPPKPVKLSKAEIMAVARETRAAKKHQNEIRSKLEREAYRIAEKEHPNAERIEIQVWNLDQGRCFVYPWYKGIAQTHEVYIEL